jgi:hypothetical protein
MVTSKGYPPLPISSVCPAPKKNLPDLRQITEMSHSEMDRQPQRHHDRHGAGERTGSFVDELVLAHL